MRDPYRLNVIADHDRKLLIFRLIGPMPSAEFVERLFEAYCGFDKPWTYARIMDMRRFEGLIEFKDVEAMAQRWAELKGGAFYPAKVAVISFDALDKARVPQASTMFPDETICHFSDYYEAMQWVTAPIAA